MHAVGLVMEVEPCSEITVTESPPLFHRTKIYFATPGVLLAVMLFIRGNRKWVSVWRGATIGNSTHEVSLQNVGKKLMPQPVWDSH